MLYRMWQDVEPLLQPPPGNDVSHRSPMVDAGGVPVGTFLRASTLWLLLARLPAPTFTKQLYAKGSPGATVSTFCQLAPASSERRNAPFTRPFTCPGFAKNSEVPDRKIDAWQTGSGKFGSNLGCVRMRTRVRVRACVRACVRAHATDNDRINMIDRQSA